MSDSSEDSDEVKSFEDIKPFFPISEWEELSSYEKKSFRNIYDNYHALQRAGFSTKLPSFMRQEQKSEKAAAPPAPKRKRAQRSSGRIRRPASDDSSDEWTPASEGRAKKKSLGRSAKKGAPLLKSSAEAFDGPSALRTYPKRPKSIKSYVEGDLLDEDDYIYCDDCELEWEGDCPQHGPLQVIQDTEVPEGTPDRASLTVPKDLAILPSKIQEAGLGVWTRQPIPSRVRFGPYEGSTAPAQSQSGYGWEIRREGKPTHCVDAADVSNSNWMRYVNCARFEQERNVLPFQYKGCLYYRTVREVPAHTELLVWYGDSYAKDLGIDPKSFKETPDNPLLVNGHFPCGVCHLSFSSPLFLETHRRSGVCSGVRSLQLEKRCDETQEEDNGASQPATAHCGACGSTFASSSYLERHRQYGACGRRIRGQHIAVQEASVEQHHALQGQREKREDPAEAEKQGLHQDGEEAKAGAEQQQQQAKDQRERKHVCETCGGAFTSSKDLRVHVRTHSGEKPYVCNTCGVAFAHSSNLRVHVRTHSGEKPYVCNTCGIAFGDSSALRRHVRTHSGEKPYVCNTCGTAFAQSDDLRRHVRTHSGEKPYVCNTCGRAFAQSADLRRHVRTHSGEKPYVCNTCGTAFARSAHLRGHVRKHAGKDEPLQQENVSHERKILSPLN